MISEKGASMNSTVMYPTKKRGEAFDRDTVERLMVTAGGGTVSMVATRTTIDNKHPMVLFAGLTKTDLQEMINTLQDICDTLEGETIVKPKYQMPNRQYGTPTYRLEETEVTEENVNVMGYATASIIGNNKAD